MQGKIQQHIQQLMKDHKRRSMWKRATAVLSAVVLLSTFLSLRNFAIAVTEENAQEAMITEAVQAALAEAAAAKENDGVTVTNEFTPDEAGATDEVVNATPEAVNTELPLEGKLTDEVSGSDTAPVTEGTVPQSPESGDRGDSPAVTSTAAHEATNNLPLEGNADTGDGSAVSGSIDTEDRSPVSDETAPAPVDIVDDPAALADAPAAVEEDAPALMMRAAPLGASTRAAGEVTSARPTYFQITDAYGSAVSRAQKSDVLTAEIGWTVDNLSQITDGSVIRLTLSDGVAFERVTGEFVTSRMYTGFIDDEYVTVWEGQIVARFELEGNTLTITHTLTAEQLRRLGKLNQYLYVGEKTWGRLRVTGLKITSSADSIFPSISSASGHRVFNDREISIVQDTADHMDGTTITDFSLLYSDGNTVYTNTPFGLHLAWDWRSASRYLSVGDYFEIELPTELTYDGFIRKTLDTYGNLAELKAHYDNGKWKLRVTYESVIDNYNMTSGSVDLIAYAPESILGYSTSRTVTVTARVAGNAASAKQLRLNVRQNDSGSSGGSSGGTWYVQTRSLTSNYYVNGYTGFTQITDLYGDGTRYQVGDSTGELGSAHLFVLADQENKRLNPDPFADPYMLFSGYNYPYINPNQRVQYVPGASNYIDAYCGDRSNRTGPRYGYTRYVMERNKTFYAGLVNDPSNRTLSATQVNRLHDILSVSFPYVSLQKMASRLGISAITDENAAVAAVQITIWNIIHGESRQVRGSQASEANRIRSALENYQPSSSYGTNYAVSFNGTPTVTFNAAGTSATVSGRLTTPLPGGITGTFSNEKGRSTSFTVNNYNGTFTATVTGISRSDKLHLNIKWSEPGETTVYYFIGSYNSRVQNLIACETGDKDHELNWEYQGSADREIEIIKKWFDENGKEISGSTLKDSVEFTLYRRAADSSTVETVAVITLQNGNYYWKRTGLPATSTSGAAYSYWVEETKVPTGYQLIGIETSGNGSVITFTAKNIEKPDKRSIKVTKQWEGIPENAQKVRSHVVLRKVMSNGSQRDMYVKLKNPGYQKAPTGDTVYGDQYDIVQQSNYVLAAWMLNRDNDWTVTYEGLPKYEADGTTLARYVFFEDWFELEVNGTTTRYNVRTDGSTYYLDDSGKEQPGGITVNVTQTQDNTQAQIDVSIKNRYTPDSLIVIKEWKINGVTVPGTSPDLPPSIGVKIGGCDAQGRELTDAQLTRYYVNGALEATLTAQGGWKHQWTVHSFKGITFYVKEVSVPEGWTGPDGVVNAVKGNDGIWRVTLVNEQSRTSVRVVKQWAGVPDSKKGDFKAVVGLFRQEDNGQNHGNGYKWQVGIKNRQNELLNGALTVTGSYYAENTALPTGYVAVEAELNRHNNWTVIFDKLPRTDSKGNEIQYLVRELYVLDADGNDVTEDFAVTYDPAVPQYPFGDGNYYSFVDMTQAEPTVTVTNTKNGSLTVEKKWVNADGLSDWQEVLPGGIRVQLSAKRNGTPIDATLLSQLLGEPTTVELNAANNWSHTWPYVHLTNMEYYVSEVGFVNGNADRYVRIDEQGNPIPYDTPAKVEYDAQNKVFRICLVNKRKPVDVELIKEDKNDPVKKLEGASFRLYDGKGQQIKNPADKDGLFRTDADGKVKIGDPNGLHLMISQESLGSDYIYKYVLVEEDAPKGYIKRSMPMTITFHVKIANGDTDIVIDNLDEYTREHNLVSRGKVAGQLQLYVKNEPATYTLPETGAMGTTGYKTGGLLLMSMAALFYITQPIWMDEKRKRRASK